MWRSFFLFLAILSIGSLSMWQCKSSSNMNNEKHKYTNRLIKETSPYLLQHAHNPVDWFPWGEEALRKAKEENKLLIISIGYAACHWCHVMEHESFEDSLVAAVMNENFVAIKVDREERPDIDDVYMTACHLVSGRGGWPLNAVALPDGKPIWAGTYFPKDQWLDLLKQFKVLNENERDKLEDSAEKLVAGLRQVDAVVDVSADVGFEESELQLIGKKFLSNIDFELGGRQGVQKFPMPNNYEFLLKYAYAFPDSRALEAVNTTLTAMANGGIYDQIEGGFSRYSVDKYWKVPHFEKMLYDNAQLVSLYAQAYRLTKDPLYKQVVEESLHFMEENWKDGSGGFYSSYDADSEGEEGKFYVYTKEEISHLIPAEELDLIIDFYNISEEGNWEESNIFQSQYSDDQFADKNGLTKKNFQTMKASWKAKILADRSSRIYPGLDDKVLCSWNALLIKGYADAYKAFGNEKYLISAIKLWSFIEENLLDKDNTTLRRNYKDGKATINAFLDDYSISISALIQLYEITFEEEYLLKADRLMKYVISHYQNDKSSMFNFTSDLDDPLVARKAELSDNVIPGSNSITARNLYALGLYLYNEEYTTLSKQMLKNMKSSITEASQPNFYSNWCNLFFDMVYEPYEVAIMGDGYKDLRNELMKEYHPNALFLGGTKEGSLKLLEDKLQDGENFIYVCVNKACKLPVQDAKAAWELMK